MSGVAQYGPRRNAVGSVAGLHTRADSTMSADELRAEWVANDAICRAALDLLWELSLDAERNGLGDEVAALALAHLESLLAQRLKRQYASASRVAPLAAGLSEAWAPLPSVVDRQTEARWKWVVRCATCVRERGSVEQALKLLCSVIATYPRSASREATTVAVPLPTAQVVAVSASRALPLAAVVVAPVDSAPAPTHAEGRARPRANPQIVPLPEIRADAVARLFALREGGRGGSGGSEAQPCFLDDVFAELRSYKRRAAQRWAATPRGGCSEVMAKDDALYSTALCGGRHSHLVAVKVRLAVISRLVAFARPSRAALAAPGGASGAATLSREHVAAVWDELVESALTESERDAALVWMRRCCRRPRVGSGASSGSGGGSRGTGADGRVHASSQASTNAADVAFAQSLWSGVDDSADASSTELATSGAAAKSLSVGDVKGHREVFDNWLSAALRGERASGNARGNRDALATDPGVLPDIFRSKVSVLLCTVTFYANLAHNLTRSP